jgi:5'-nucleotidase
MPTRRVDVAVRCLGLVTVILLSACAEIQTSEPVPGPVTQFRLAAEQRVSWHADGIPADAPGKDLVHAKILGFNDFHGNLNQLSIEGRPVGGAAVLAAYLQSESAEIDGNAIIVHAGDMVGASPPESALMQDEPAIQFLNMMANEHCAADELTNPHEFDEGIAEIMRLHFGGRHEDAPSMFEDWKGAKFPYVLANVIVSDTGKTLLPPYVIKDVDGVAVAFIGAVVKNTPTIVSPSSVVGIEFLDEAKAINKYVPELKALGVRAIIVTIHHGLIQQTIGANAIVGQDDLQGPFIDIVASLDDEIDIVISGHEHDYTNILVPTASGKQILLTQAFENGTAYGDIDIALDPVSGDIVSKSATINTTWADQGPGLTPDEDARNFVETVNTAVKPLVSRVVGVAAAAMPKRTSSYGEIALGNLLVDAVLEAMDVDIAFIGSSLRASIDAGEILWGELFAVMPFGNHLVAMDLTGKQIMRLLSRQFEGRQNPYYLQVAGMSYTWDAARPADDRIIEVQDASGAPLDPERLYRVGVSSFFATGGQGFIELTQGTDRVTGPILLDAVIEHIQSLPQPISAKIEGRIKRLN